MEARNLTQENVKDLDAVMKDLQEDNPDLSYKFFNQNDGLVVEQNIQIDIERLEKKIDILQSKINLIFGDQVLMNGYWKTIK